jgi:hypothetical protein
MRIHSLELEQGRMSKDLCDRKENLRLSAELLTKYRMIVPATNINVKNRDRLATLARRAHASKVKLKAVVKI